MNRFTRSSPAARSRLAGDRGATLAEAAIITPLFFLLLLGIVEFGLLFRTYLTVTGAARDGARAGSAADAPGFADYNILQEVRRSIAAISTRDLQRIVVFKGDRTAAFESQVPPACLTTPGVDDLCNVYFADDLEKSQPLLVASGRTDNWPEDERDDNLGNDGTDFLGVYVQANHHGVTGVLGTDKEVRSITVMRIEPKQAVE